MAKKEVQVFGMSFLDLLSGALAAVIILFIIVPKMDMQSKDAVEAMKELGVEVDGLVDKLKQLENSVDKDLFEEIMEQLETIQDALSDAQQQVEKLEERVEDLEAQVDDLQKYKEWMENCGFGLEDDCPPKRRSSKGFQYQGKNIIFIVDVSGSMQSPSEDRLSPVKAGIKMLLATMDDQYQTDLVRFPYQSDCDYKANFGQLMPITDSNRENLYSFLRSLNANGGTPASETLEYVLSSYTGVTDIVLLTDGEPGCASSHIPDILSMVRRLNTNGIQINAIGVGRDFFDDPNAPKVQFLEQLSSQNGNGFFIQFD